jgi:FAD/FMN-containing dehydrogenase
VSSIDPLRTSIDALRTLVGEPHVLTSANDKAPYLLDWRRRYHAQAQAVVLPASTAEVARVVAWCAETRTPVVPQGGNTGLVGGASPDESGRAIVLSLKRLHRIRAVDTANGTLVAEAGCVLKDVQDAAQAHGQLFPLSLAAEGSATIGGNLSTNAGGVQVLRYGNARELCLGLEVVLPSGEVWHGLRGLRKDNTGYDLRDLFIGAEGTLGVITAACLKTFPQPRARATALVAVPSLPAALQLLAIAQTTCGPTLTAFECFSDFCLTLVERHYPPHRTPFSQRHSQHVVVELSDHEDATHANALLESLAGSAIEAGMASDAVIAQSVAQARAFWSLRELISEAQALEGKNIKHDIAVPISGIARFVEETDRLLQQRFPGVRMVVFGHLGDGNLHYNVSPPIGMDEPTFLALQPAVYSTVHDQVHAFGGSISAEHGIGQLKRAENARYKSEIEMRLMRTLKQAFDPLGIMNPGKVL